MSTSIRRPILTELTSTVRAMLARNTPERVLFMTGEAGIGKSTLLAQLIAELESDAENVGSAKAPSPIIATAECSTPVAGSGVGFVEALKPFADIMSALVEAGIGGSETPRGAKKGSGRKFKLDIGKFFVDTAPSWIGLIPVIGGPIFHALNIVGSGYDQVYLHNKLRAESAGAASNQEQVFRQYINFLSKISSEVPVLIILDDFHWADTSSTNLLFAAARDLASSPVVFLVVYREDDVKRLSNAEEHALPRVRDELERYSMSHALVVPPADQHDLNALIQSQYTDYTTNEVLEEWLLHITDGNLLFATQFLSTLEHDNYLESGSASVLKDLASVPVPSGARAVVAGYIRRLNEDDKDQLRFVSVEGETITAQMAARLLELSLLKTIPRLRLFADKFHILRSLGTVSVYANETTAYQFVHYLVHKALYDDLAKEERTLLHSLAADALLEELVTAETAQYNVHVVASRLAAHATIAERFDTAAEAFLKGAQWVWKSYAADEAHYLIEQCQAAIRSQRNPSESLRLIGIDALLLKADMFQRCSLYSDSEACYVEAISIANEYGSPKQRSEAYVGLAAVQWVSGNFAEGEATARIALQIATEANDIALTVRPLRIIGNSFFTRGMFDNAVEYNTQSRDAAIACGDEIGRATAMITIGNVFSARGRFQEALVCQEESLALYRRLRYSDGITLALSNAGSTYSVLCEYEKAMACLNEGLEIARSSGDLRVEAFVICGMSTIHQRTGNLDEALRLAEQSLAIAERIGERDALLTCLSAVGRIYKSMNRFEEALEYFSRSLAMAIEVNNHFNIGRMHLSRATVFVSQGRLKDAIQCFQSSANVFANLGEVEDQIDALIGAICCSLKLESSHDGNVIVSPSEILERARALVREEDFTMAAYDTVFADWLGLFDEYGITIEGESIPPASSQPANDA